MIVSIEESKELAPQSTRDMMIGQVAEIEGTRMYGGNRILRTYDGFVSLDDPAMTWRRDSEFTVRILPKGSKVTLETA